MAWYNRGDMTPQEAIRAHAQWMLDFREKVPPERKAEVLGFLVPDMLIECRREMGRGFPVHVGKYMGAMITFLREKYRYPGP